MSEINIQVVPGQQIEVDGRRFETTGELRKPIACEYWLSETATRVYYGLCSNPRLILRPLPVRKIPTDQDAAVWPRRKCWVRDSEDHPWSDDGAYFLLGVRQADFSFLVFNNYGNTAGCRFCEIEVEE